MITLKKLLLEATPNHNEILETVQNKRVVVIHYQGDRETEPGYRTILPVCYGAKKVKDGRKDYIRAWQNAGKTVRGIPKWKLFRVDRIDNWEVSNQSFAKPPDPRFNTTGDKWMQGGIYAIAKFGKSDYRFKDVQKNIAKTTSNLPKIGPGGKVQENKTLLKNILLS